VLSRYRWLVLAAGTAAQTSFSAVIIGLPVLAPELRDAHGLSLVQVGVVLDSLWIGTLVTLLPWGLLADRRGERFVLATGLTFCAGALIATGNAGGFWSLIGLIFLAGAAGASVNAASGRAVMQWFPSNERGFALGIRQTAIPVGGLISALVLPMLGLRAAFVFLAALCLAGAAFGVAVIRDPTRSDQIPLPIRMPAATTCAAPSTPAAAAPESPRSSCRKRTRKLISASCATR
jgi:sugar phosphate permease